MSFKRVLGYTAPLYTHLTKTEEKILETIIAEKSGNAYGLWKASGLKHYPTVWRILNKLEKKRLVQVLSEKGPRDEIIYGPTILGKLLLYALREDETNLVKVASLNSHRFKQMVESEVIEPSNWAYSFVRWLASDAVAGRSRTFDEIIKDSVSEIIHDFAVNIINEKDKNEIIKLSRLEWIRELTMDQIEREIELCKEEIQELRKLKKTLTQT